MCVCVCVCVCVSMHTCIQIVLVSSLDDTINNYLYTHVLQLEEYHQPTIMPKTCIIWSKICCTVTDIADALTNLNSST